MTIPDSARSSPEADAGGVADRWRLCALGLLIVVHLGALLISPSFRRIAIARCPARSIEVGRNVADEPSCLRVDAPTSRLHER